MSEMKNTAAPEAVAVYQRWCPDVCPITGRKFFMWITHHDTGDDVPTYGGPFDSYTIPVKNEDGSYSCERYDHDFGGWREWEDVGLTIVDDQSFVVEPDNQRYDEIRDFAEGRAALAATPAADAPMVDMTPPATRRDRWMYEQGRQAERDPRTANSIGQDAARYRWLRNESWAGYNIAKRKPEVALVALTRDGAGNIKLILAEDGMDTAIDAAIAAAKREAQ